MISASLLRISVFMLQFRVSIGLFEERLGGAEFSSFILMLS